MSESLLRRTVSILLTEEFVRDTPGPISRTVCEAIGFLANWSIGGRFSHVKILGEAGGYLEAQYSTKEGDDLGYVIGAVLEADGRYSFNS